MNIQLFVPMMTIIKTVQLALSYNIDYCNVSMFSIHEYINIFTHTNRQLYISLFQEHVKEK